MRLIEISVHDVNAFMQVADFKLMQKVIRIFRLRDVDDAVVF